MFSDNENELLGRTQRILLELSTVLFFTAKNSAIPLIQQYVYFLVAKKYNVSICADDCEWEADSNATNASLAHLDLLERVNEESSLIVLYLNLAELLPAAVVVLFLGAWSDVTGRRKFLMWLPCLGNAVYALGFVLPWYINGGDVDSATTKVFFVMACIISGLSGSIPGFLSGNASYISDTDSRGRRTLRLAIVELSIGLTFGISNLIHGYWIDITRHFAQPLWFVFGCSLVPFFILFFLLREPNGEVTSELGHPTTFRDLKPIRRVFGCTSRSQRKLWAIFIVFLVYVFIQQGQERTFVLYLQSAPLYWRSVQIGTFLFVLYTLSGIGCWPGIPLMLRLVSDVDIGLIALLSKVIGSSILAFATETKTIYLSAAIQMFHLTPYAVIRSLASKEVGEDEQGSLYALLHSAQCVVAFLGPLAHNVVFALTASIASGIVFIIFMPLLVIAVYLLAVIKRLGANEECYSMLGGANAAQPLTPTTIPLSEASEFLQPPPRPSQNVDMSN